MVVIAFFGALNIFGLGLVGSYAWRAYENTKRRPLATIQSARQFSGVQHRLEDQSASLVASEIEPVSNEMARSG
jgi:hypothetical protein